MSVTIYESPDDGRMRGRILVEATSDYIWFWGQDEGDESAHIPKTELAAIVTALQEYQEEVEQRGI